VLVVLHHRLECLGATSLVTERASGLKKAQPQQLPDVHFWGPAFLGVSPEKWTG